MSRSDNEIIAIFVYETKVLIGEMIETLEQAEGDVSLAPSLEKYGQFVDRIMGSAKNIAINYKDKNHPLHRIGDYSAICKAVAYKTSQIVDNENFYQVCVAFLMDATEVLKDLVEIIEKRKTNIDMRIVVSQTLIERLKWVSNQFTSEYRSTVAVNDDNESSFKVKQQDIDQLIKKLGVG